MALDAALENITTGIKDTNNYIRFLKGYVNLFIVMDSILDTLKVHGYNPMNRIPAEIIITMF